MYSLPGNVWHLVQGLRCVVFYGMKPEDSANESTKRPFQILGQHLNWNEKYFFASVFHFCNSQWLQQHDSDYSELHLDNLLVIVVSKHFSVLSNMLILSQEEKKKKKSSKN